jgi:citrate lyase subunit beta/citryl-CoA lyase
MSYQDRGQLLRQARTFLFTPGDQPERIVKALKLKTDAVIIDLEDAVSEANKAVARNAIVAPIHENRSEAGPLIILRTNAFASPEFAEDLKMAFELNVDAIMLPKFIPGTPAQSVDENITAVEVKLGRQDLLPVIALIESTVGVLNLLSVSSFSKRVVRLAYGAADLHADLGVTYSNTGANSGFAMASLVMASVNCGLAAPIDSPHFDLEDEVGLRATSHFARDMGFGGKLCIHPKQLEIVATSFERSQSDQVWATQVMDNWNQRSENSGAILVDGSLVDEAMVKRARQILSLL